MDKDVREGDIVARKSYNQDLYFKIVEFYAREDGQRCAVLRGIDVRLCADAPVADLEKISQDRVAEHWRKVMTSGNDYVRRCFQRREEELQGGLDRGKRVATFDVPGKVLHLDGDADYLDLCSTYYRQLGVPAKGYFIPEAKQPSEVAGLLQEHRPDILVLTGHDALKKGSKDFRKMDSYRNSIYFVQAVRIAREYEKNLDDLVIFAGACQSFYEALLEAGANFASAPERVLIHAFDPVFVVERVAYTPAHQPIALKAVIEATKTGYPGIGGLDTQGKFRMGAPKSAY